MPRPRGRFQQVPENEERHRLERVHDHDRNEDRRQVCRRRKRCPADPFEDPRLAARDDDQREAGECGVRDAVRKHSGEQRPRRGTPVYPSVVDRGEQREEEQRKEKDEDGRFASAPEHKLLPADLVPEEPHSSSSATSAR